MEEILIYILKFSITIGVFSLFYALVLGKLTFYRWNRVYFIASVVMSLVLPFIDITVLWSGDSYEGRRILQSIPAVSDVSFPLKTRGYSSDSSAMIVLTILTGSVIMFFRFVAQYISLVSLRRNSVLIHQEQGIKLYDPGKRLAPFSFGRSVYIHQAMHTSDEFEQIAEHEIVHVRQHHTVDILLSELLCILNWFNPFAWIMRKFIRQNLEFIADQVVLSKGADAKQYQYLLLKSSDNFPFTVVNTFSMQNLKKRIIMMNAIKSSGPQFLKFIAVVPVVFLLSIIFRSSDVVAQVGGPVTLQSEGGVEIRSASKNVKPLYIVDGLQQSSGFDVKLLKAEDIRSVSVWKGQEAVRKFGPAATHGAIEIGTRLPLYVVDGVVQMKTSNAGDLLKADNIASMHVLKGESAKAKYGHSGENGAIEIITKKEK